MTFILFKDVTNSFCSGNFDSNKLMLNFASFFELCNFELFMWKHGEITNTYTTEDHTVIVNKLLSVHL